MIPPMNIPMGKTAALAPDQPRRSILRILRRRTRTVVEVVVLVAAIGAWALLLRPGSLGGPATYVVVSGTSMEPAFHTGDLVVTRRRRSYAKGDIVAYHVPKGDPGAGRLVIHRVIGGSTRSGYVMQGDNRKSPDLWRPKPADVAGKTWFHIPIRDLGISRLFTPLGLAMAAGALAFLLVVTAPLKRRPG
jgi:signal peptidase